MSGQRPFDLGGWRVDPLQGTLSNGDKTARLEPRLMDLLLLFAASPGRVIAKAEIVAAVWGGRAIGDDTLAGAISRLRSVLGETAHERFIETLPKRGYRLVVSPDASPSRPISDANDDVSDLLRKGRAALNVPLPQSLAQARIYFEAAVAADPTSAEAHAGLAEAMLIQHQVGQGAAYASAAKASALAATALDPDLAIAWALRGTATLMADRDFAAADSAFHKALALAPDLAIAHRGRGFALAATGRFVEAEREARRAIELEPLSVTAHIDLIQCLFAARRFSHALSESKKLLQLGAQLSDAWAAAGWANVFLGNHRDAVDALLESLRVLGTDAATIARLRAAYDSDGFVAFCAAGADLFGEQRIMFVPRPMDMAMLRANAGQADAAFSALEEAVRRDDPVTLLLPWLPHLDRLRNDPRFATILARVRLVR
jgi:DNA-binding winged helix-turn-helix (wHTH) protein/Flp pilus assembly protein TadD